MQWDWSIDGWIVLAGALCSVASALVGNFLLLRRLSMLGDAISHAALPGIAAAFLFTGQRSSIVVFAGAAAMGLATVWLTELIRKHGRVEESAAIGVVFTSLFAIGLILMVRAGDKIDLDPSCVLYGNLEMVILDTVPTFLGDVPRVVLSLFSVCILNACVIFFMYRQWQLTTFDPLQASAQGVSTTWYHYLLASLVAVTCIASFEAVGNILVIAMLVVPSATSFLICKRLPSMIFLSVILGAMAAASGRLSAVFVPALLGWRAVNSAAMIVLMSGFMLTLAILFSPKSGVIHRWLVARRSQRAILGQDVLSFLYRRAEQASLAETNADLLPGKVPQYEIAAKLRVSLARLQRTLSELARQEWIVEDGKTVTLTGIGRKMAQNLVRSHRLWEQYLSVEMNVSDDRLHTQAESLEHFTNRSMRGQLDLELGKSTMDPHGRSIPPEG
jgi:manganese/zinc/iron transport system permease protein